MKVYGIIPLRSKSLSIPQKNIKPIAGKPLAQWAIDCCNNSTYIEETFIAIDDINTSKVLKDSAIFLRSQESSTDTSPTIQVVVEFCRDKNMDDIIVLVQATSPLVQSQYIDRGVAKILNGECDSCLSAVRQKKFIWSEDGIPQNYNLSNRPRRQDWRGILIENGAFYISTVRGILSENNILHGKIGIIEMNSDSYHEIDEPEDWDIVEYMLLKKCKTLI